VTVAREYEDLLRKYDVILLPAVPFTAPPLFDRSTASTMEQISSTFGQTLNTMQFNLTGHPAMVLPTGFARDMSGENPDVFLPTSIQIVGPLHGEKKILQVGYAYEQTYQWKHHREE
jgi:amidase